MIAHDTIDQARERLANLILAVSPHLPLDVPTTGRDDHWAVTGPAFVARSTRLVQALLELPDEHESAAGVLLRVIYEHVATFAWLAIDPPKHLPQWVRQDRVQRLKIENDLAAFGRPLLSSERRTAFEAERDSVPDEWPAVPGMAQLADAHWATRMNEFSTDVYGLRGMYGAVYRPFSALVHGMADSLHRIVGVGPAHGVCRVGVEEDPPENNAFTMAPFIYALGLLVSSEANGFPERELVHGSFRRPE